MAEPTSPASPGSPAPDGDAAAGERELGAPIARDQIDPELVKLGRAPTTIGVVTAAGVVVLCLFYLVRLGPDRRFAGSATTPRPVAAAEVVAGKVDLDQLVAVPGEPLVAHAIRASKAEGTLGFRVVPLRNTADQLWLVAPGDGWDASVGGAYEGRLRALDDLTFGAAVRAYAAAHPRPVFATAAAVRAGFATGAVTTVTGEQVKLAPGDRVALDVVDPAVATVVATFNERLPDAAAWTRALSDAAVPATAAGPADEALGQQRFTVAMPVSIAATKLETAKLLAARVDPVTRHFDTTWSVLRASPPAGLAVGATTIADPQVELVGLYVGRDLPAGAYALVLGESPADYWYVMPITVALAGLILVFGWALVRAVRRDLAAVRAG